jgi:mRNA interferase MazF
MYVPERGDIVWLAFDPQVGREQAGRRPAVVLSPKSYNGKVGLAICCPITNQAKGYPFEVPLPAGGDVTGVVLADHVRSVDWKGRQASFIAQLPVELLNEVLDRIEALLRD